MATPAKLVEFHFDVVCPFAYLASRRIEAVARRAQASVEWRPTLLGGLYRDTQAPQGKDGSASDAMPASKRALAAQDLMREAERQGAPLHWNPHHPARSLAALRLLCGAPPERRAGMAHALYRAYWVDGEDLEDAAVLRRVAEAHGVPPAAGETPEARAALQRNTDLAVERGAFGVPSFWAAGRLFFGQDRMHFVEQALGAPERPRQLRLRADSGNGGNAGGVVEFFHDFASPWSFLGSTQVARVAAEAGARLVYRPVLLGALFRAIGTPNMPMAALSDAKRAYGARDLQDWAEWWGLGDSGFSFPSCFPVRTVLPCRVAIAEPAATDAIYAACWLRDVNVGDEAALRAVLAEAGFDADALVQAAGRADVKAALRENTQAAIDAGFCGVPSFRVNGSELVWGQDRLNVVSDMLCGAEVGSRL